ncbi:hypothetical protein ACWCOT_04540 [Nonomuraea bangladeshensis]
MNVYDATQRYEYLLLGEGSWLSEELAWTVLMPQARKLTLDDVARRVTRINNPAIVERDFEEAYGANAIVLEGTGNGVMIVDLNRISDTPDPEFIAEISAGTEVWHISWHTALSRRMIHALDGRILAAIPSLDPAQAVGEDLSSVRAELEALDATQNAPWPATEATALAIIEDRTGARLLLDWFDRPHPSVVIEP